MAWQPTPEHRKFRAVALDGAVLEMKDLKPGDVVRIVDPRGQVVNPFTEEADDKVVAKVTGWPVKNVDNCIGSLSGAMGYGVPMELFESIEDVKRGGLS